MPADETHRRRLRLACRHGGRSAARSRLAAELDPHTAGVRGDQGPSASSGAADPRAERTLPAGYRSSPSPQSSLSSGGLTYDTNFSEDPEREYAFLIGGWECLPDLTGVEAVPLAAAAGPPEAPATAPQPVPAPVPAEEHHPASSVAEAAAAPPAAPHVLPPAAPELAAGDILEANRLPEFEAPPLSTRVLAGIAASALAAYPSSSVDVVQGVVQDQLHRLTASQRRTVDLAVDFGCELLREMSAQLVRNLADHFRDLPDPPQHAQLLSN